MAITLEQIEKALEDNKQNHFITKHYKNIDLGVDIKAKIAGFTIEEQKTFVDTVFGCSYLGSITPSSIDTDVAFVIIYMKMFTDIPIPMADIPVSTTKDEDGDTDKVEMQSVIDTEKAYSIARILDINSIIEDNPEVVKLRKYVDDKIEYHNRQLIAYAGLSTATDEAIENFSDAMIKIAELADVGMSQLEKNGNKLFKNLTKKKIDSVIDTIQNAAIKNLVDKENNLKVVK